MIQKNSALVFISLAAVLTLSACSTSNPVYLPKVEDRSVGRPVTATTTNPPASSGAGSGTAVSSTPSAGVVSTGAASTGNTSKPAITGKTYTVKRGDTLFSIALENGLSYREIAAWNDISNPDVIKADQVLRLTAPDAGSAVAQSVPVPSPTSSSASTATVPAQPATTSPVKPATANNALTWQWPAKGRVIESYTEGKNKGIDIAAALGTPVVAAADGKVIYANSGLKGYGQLIMIKHNDDFVTAYAHNHKILIKEEQEVKRGQHIADMGSTESDTVKLHFEVRRQGKPQDPVALLPKQ